MINSLTSLQSCGVRSHGTSNLGEGFFSWTDVKELSIAYVILCSFFFFLQDEQKEKLRRQWNISYVRKGENAT